MQHARIWMLIVLAVCGRSVALLSGQSISGRTPSAVFGGARAQEAGQKMRVSFGIAEAFDTTVPVALRSHIPLDGLQNGGFSSVLDGSVTFALQNRRASVGGTAETAYRHYQTAGVFSAVGHAAAVGASVRLPASAALELEQTFAYSPSYFYQLFPSTTPPLLGAGVPVAPDYRIEPTDSYVLRSRATFAIGSARGTHVRVSGDFGRTEFEEGAARPDLKEQSASASFSRGFGRTSGLRFEYQYRTGEFGLLGVTTEHRMTMGVEYGHALSVSRRLSLRADVTPTRTTLPASVRGSVERLDKIDTALTFTYPIRLGWETAATYQRGFEYVAGLEAPIFVDAARVNLNGLIGRRIDVHATAAYVDGISAYRQNDQLEGYTANVRMRLAWTRSVAAFSEYVYYRYNFQARLLAVDLPSSFEQNSVRVGLAFWTSFR